MANNSPQPAWGFLLPLNDVLPPFELRQEKATAGADKSCDLQLDAAVQMAAGLPSTVGCLFKVIRSKTGVSLRVESSHVKITGNTVLVGQDIHLEHGACISLGDISPAYEYINREASDSFKAPPDLLLKYFVGHRIGGGGFGEVRLLFDKRNKYQRYAMKIVEPYSDNEQKYADREYKILRSLRHPCVVAMFSIKRLGTLRFFIMDFLPGGDLSQYVNEKGRQLTEAQTKLIFFQLALAVSFLHQKKICHRDLKPANILLQHRDPYTRIKVTDFGLAKTEFDSLLKTRAGTKPFLAPEIVREEKAYSKAVDIWSMGVILYCSLTGTLPFRTEHEASTQDFLVKYPPEKWTKVTVTATQLVRDMLNADVYRRPTVATVLTHTWLRDNVMLEEVYHLTGIHSIRPSSRARTPLLGGGTQRTSVFTRVVVDGPESTTDHMCGGSLVDKITKSCIVCWILIFLAIVVLGLLIAYHKEIDEFLNPSEGNSTTNTTTSHIPSVIPNISS